MRPGEINGLKQEKVYDQTHPRQPRVLHWRDLHCVVHRIRSLAARTCRAVLYSGFRNAMTINRFARLILIATLGFTILMGAVVILL